MLNYIVKRLLLMIPTLLGISVIVFVVVRFAPGDPTTLQFHGAGGGMGVDPGMRAMHSYFWGGEDVAVPVQYWRWITKVVQFDLGKSITEKRPVAEMVGERLGLTIKLNLISALLAYLISIPLGLVAAKNRFAGPVRRFVFDTANGVVLIVLYSLPVIFVGTGLILVFSSGGILEGWLESQGWSCDWLIMPVGGVVSPQSDQLGFWAYVGDVARHFILPVATLTLGGLAFMSKLARNSLLENLRQDYVQTARAKGLRERTVVYVHALRNSLLPMITVVVMVLPLMISGSIIVEHIFSLPGMGQLFFQAATRRDYTTVQAISLIGAVLTLVAILIGDILYAFADPRVRYE